MTLRFDDVMADEELVITAVYELADQPRPVRWLGGTDGVVTVAIDDPDPAALRPRP